VANDSYSSLPSDNELIDRATRLANDYIMAVDIQLRRIRTADETVDDWPYVVWLDFQFLIVALARLRRAAVIARSVSVIKDHMQTALTAFDRAIPNIRDMRNVAEHIDEYAQDSPARRLSIDRRQLEVGAWDDNQFTWLGWTINYNHTLVAATQLYGAIRKSRNLLDSHDRD
jgi:hypothetical protein